MKPLLHNKKLSGLIQFFKTCYSVAVKIKKGLMFHMTEKTKRRSDLRFEREAEALRKNLEKRKKQQEALQKKSQTEKVKDDGQTKD